jgi:inorganic pyrophosphatase
MDLSKLATGRNVPDDINVVVEIPAGGAPAKYEVDKDSGAVFVDRIMHTAMYYPGNYGFIPNTLSNDGDPCDVVVISPVAVVPGAVMPCRPIGVLLMEDESGGDEKIIAVPSDRIFSYYKNVQSYKDLPPLQCEQIAHFFQHYKDLEKGKWVKIARWGDADEAKAMILEGLKRAAAKAA